MYIFYFRHSLHVILLPLQEKPPKILTTNPFLEVVDFNVRYIHDTYTFFYHIRFFFLIFCFNLNEVTINRSNIDEKLKHVYKNHNVS